MAAPVRLIPALPPRHQSTEDRLAEMDAKIGHLIDGSAICSPPRTESPSVSTMPRCDRAEPRQRHRRPCQRLPDHDAIREHDTATRPEATITPIAPEKD